MDIRRNPRVFRAWRVERLKNTNFAKANRRASMARQKLRAPARKGLAMPDASDPLKNRPNSL